jgi:hypothetical protein
MGRLRRTQKLKASPPVLTERFQESMLFLCPLRTDLTERGSPKDDRYRITIYAKQFDAKTGHCLLDPASKLYRFCCGCSTVL